MLSDEAHAVKGERSEVHRKRSGRPLTVECAELLSSFVGNGGFVFLGGWCLATGSEAEGAWGDAGWE